MNSSALIQAPPNIESEQKAETTVKTHTQKKNSGSVQDVIPKDIPVEQIIHELPENQRMCPHCGEEMTFEVDNFDFDEDYLCPNCHKPLFPEAPEEE